MCHKSNLPIFIFMMQGSRRIISISLHTEVLHLNVNATEYLPSYHCISHRATSFRSRREHKYRFPIALRITTNVYTICVKWCGPWRLIVRGFNVVFPLTWYPTSGDSRKSNHKIRTELIPLCVSPSLFVKNHNFFLPSLKCIHPHVSRSQYRS